MNMGIFEVVLDLLYKNLLYVYGYIEEQKNKDFKNAHMIFAYHSFVSD